MITESTRGIVIYDILVPFCVWSNLFFYTNREFIKTARISDHEAIKAEGKKTTVKREKLR